MQSIQYLGLKHSKILPLKIPIAFWKVASVGFNILKSFVGKDEKIDVYPLETILQPLFWDTGYEALEILACLNKSITWFLCWKILVDLFLRKSLYKE